MLAHRDPFPSVPCSLLSSAAIHDYVRLTGMLHPYYPTALKSASYEAHITGRFIWWDEHDRKHDNEIGRGDPCVLPANSITFVQAEPLFRLPDYIAVRFNLRITHVHRGLLLGTGPLVDPGFEGKLLIPLHNLTSSKYDLDTKEALIWIEFTKTTYGGVPTEPDADTQRNFVRFPSSKKTCRRINICARLMQATLSKVPFPSPLRRAAETPLQRPDLRGRQEILS